MADPQLQVGAIVHYVDTNGRHLAAIVCAAREGDMLDLFVMDSARMAVDFKFPVPYDASGNYVFTWHWPEYIQPIAPSDPLPSEE